MGMRLLKLSAERYLSLKDVTLELGGLNLFIGANAAGKSNLLNALRFLAEGLTRGDFDQCVAERGGLMHLAWKGEDASRVRLETTFANGTQEFMWRLTLSRQHYSFVVDEELRDVTPGSAGAVLLEVRGGTGRWWSEEARTHIPLELRPTACALAAAATDASFRARGVAQFVSGWGFFDPSASQLRRASSVADAERLDLTGRNLAGRLHGLSEKSPTTFRRIIDAVRGVLGVPDELEFRVSEADGRVYFVQQEAGLRYRVHQVGASSGTLRMLALMTALFGETDYGLVGIEEPENHVHPAALATFAEYLKEASGRVQVLVTTHSPLLLDHLDTPDAVCVVRRGTLGTTVDRESNSDAVSSALRESGFGLGEYHETKGFGQ